MNGAGLLLKESSKEERKTKKEKRKGKENSRIFTVLEKNLGNQAGLMVLFLFALFCLYSFWMFSVPMQNAPDELTRVILSEYMVDHGQLPNGWSSEVRILNWGSSYALRPCLVNMVGAVFLGIVNVLNGSAYWRLMAVRFPSVIAGTVLVLYVFKTGHLLGWKNRWIWCAGCIVGLMPQISFLASYNNNDLFALCCCAMVSFYCLNGMKEDWSWLACFKLSVALSLTMLSYYNAYPYVLFSVPLFVISQIHRQMKAEDWLEILKKGLFISALVFLFSGWWFIRNMILYDGDALGNRTIALLSEQFAIPELKPSFKKTYQDLGRSVWQTIFVPFDGARNSWLQRSWYSLIGNPGIMEYYLPGRVYTLFKLFFAGGAFGLLISWIRRAADRIKGRLNQPEKREDWILLQWQVFNILSAVLVFALAVWYSWAEDFQPQGRYLIPFLASLTFLALSGYIEICGWLQRLCSRCFLKRVSWSTLVSTLMILFMAYVQVWSLKDIVLPHFVPKEKILREYEERYWKNMPGERSPRDPWI